MCCVNHSKVKTSLLEARSKGRLSLRLEKRLFLAVFHTVGGTEGASVSGLMYEPSNTHTHWCNRDTNVMVVTNVSF